MTIATTTADFSYNHVGGVAYSSALRSAQGIGFAATAIPAVRIRPAASGTTQQPTAELDHPRVTLRAADSSAFSGAAPELKDEEDETWVEKANKRLSVIEKTCFNDWNSYGAERPNDYAIWSARRVVKCAAQVGIFATRIDPSAENGITITFANNSRWAVIECLNSRETDAVLSKRDGIPEIRPVGSRPDDVVTCLVEIKAFLNP